MYTITGEVIRQRRLEAGISQKRMAKILVISQHTLSGWERGAEIPAKQHERVRIGLRRLATAGADPSRPRDLRSAPDDWHQGLRERREAAGLSAVSLARRVNIRPDMLSHYESGRKRVPWSLMEVIEAALRDAAS